MYIIQCNVHIRSEEFMAIALSKLRKVLGSSTHLLLSFHEHVAAIIDMHPYHEYVAPIIDIHHYQQHNVYYVLITRMFKNSKRYRCYTSIFLT